jgi:hypothetical protein
MPNNDEFRNSVIPSDVDKGTINSLKIKRYYLTSGIYLREA